MKDTTIIEKLKGRDFIIIGIFGLLFMIVEVIAAFGVLIAPAAFAFTFAIAAIPCGIIFMYIIAKVPKRWVIASVIALCSILYFLVGTYGIWTPLFGATGGLIADFIARTGQYKKFSKNTVAFIVVLIFQWLGFMYPIILTTEQYIQTAVAGGQNEATLMIMINYIKGFGFTAGLIATFVMALVGAYIGRTVLKKHFQKAGIV